MSRKESDLIIDCITTLKNEIESLYNNALDYEDYRIESIDERLKVLNDLSDKARLEEMKT